MNDNKSVTEKFIFKILPHVSTVIAFMILTFCIIDMQNNAMAFLDNSMTRGLLIIYAIISIIINCAIYLKQDIKTVKQQYNAPATKYNEAPASIPVQTNIRAEVPSAMIEQNTISAENQANASDGEIDEKLKLLLENQKKLSENIEILAKMQASRNKNQ